MTNPLRCSSSIWCIRLRAASAALALAVVLVLTVVATQSAQAQSYSVLYSFTWGADGNSPVAGLIRDAAGNLYGTTTQGGTPQVGTVFKVDKTGKETVLHAFTGHPDGANPKAGLVRDAAGNLYGTTSIGGSHQCGTVFKLDTTGKETVLYNFCSLTKAEDGKNPYAGLIRDAAGNLYGTTSVGGLGFGVVFKLDTTGHETVLYAFTGGADGANPTAGLIRDAAGNIYGTTSEGGATGGQCGDSGCGVVFTLDTTRKETVLHAFTGQPDGANPEAGLLRDAAGNLYGTTSIGGDLNTCYDGFQCGVVFKVDTTGKETVLYSFTGGTGFRPAAGLIRDAAGNLYGTTLGGGSIGFGVVFKLDTDGKETVLYSFCPQYPHCTDGATPAAGLIRDAAGNIYGTTKGGGLPGCSGDYGCGVVFKLTP